MSSRLPMRKLDSLEYSTIVTNARRIAREVIPLGARVLVVSRGDDELLALGGLWGGHFPQTDGGMYAGHYPADDHEAIGHLEAMRVKGVTHLLIPQPSFWWLEHYRQFHIHLVSCYRTIHRDGDVIVFDVAGGTNSWCTRGDRKSCEVRKVHPVDSRYGARGAADLPRGIPADDPTQADEGAEPVDVIVPVYRDAEMTRRCLESVLQHDDGLLRNLIVVNDASPDSDMPAVLERVARLDPRVRLLKNVVNLGFVTTCNRGLAERTGDAVLLNSDTLVTPGWLTELAHVARSEPRVACVTPLSNNATICSVPKFCAETPADLVDATVVREACAGLPRSTCIPTGIGFCLYLCGPVLDLIGGLDPIFGLGYNEENDWCMRAQVLGFTARRANRAFVYHYGSVSFSGAKAELNRVNAQRLEERHPHYLAQVRTFCTTLDGRLPAHAARVRATGKVRVALDIRHLPPHPIGTSNYAGRLARELAQSTEVDLTLITRGDMPPFDFPARVVHENRFLDDVEVIHKPSQVFDPKELELLTRSPAHMVVSYLDMIAYRAQGLFPEQAVAGRYRSLSYFALQAAQATIAISFDAKAEIVRELGIPADRVFVVPCGVDANWFRTRPTGTRGPAAGGEVPPRYLLAVGTDFPHKNLPNLLEAYALFRSAWVGLVGPNPPALVIAGYRTSYPQGLFGRLKTDLRRGIFFAGAVTDEELRSLYQGAVAFVFPSIYEGFGLPLLEAMAAGTPVVAMRISSVPEVGEGGVLYPDGFTPQDLAIALSRVCTDLKLRAELIDAGNDRVKAFQWRRMGLATIDVYKSVVFHPSEKSLLARRHMSQSLLGHFTDVSPSPGETHFSVYHETVRRIHGTADKVLPPGSPVLVVSKGDDELLKFSRNHGWHFPRTENGSYLGHHPADCEKVIAHLEDQRVKGGQFLVLPNTGFWWLDHYPRFKQHLAEKYDRIWDDADCMIFRLTVRCEGSVGMRTGDPHKNGRTSSLTRLDRTGAGHPGGK